MAAKKAAAAEKKLGPGRKECPECHEIVGARTKVCECGHEFPQKDKPAKASAVASSVGFADALKKVREAEEKVKAWGQRYADGKGKINWEIVRTGVEEVFDLAEALGGENELLQVIDAVSDK